MGALTNIIGLPPVSTSLAFRTWEVNGVRTLLALHPIAGDTTYYISTSGNTANNGTSTATPKVFSDIQTIHDAWNGSGRLTFLLRNGDVFSDTASGTQFLSLTKANVSIGRYGTAAAGSVARKPRLTRYQSTSTSGWTLTSAQTNTYQQAATTEVVVFREAGDVTGNLPYVRRQSIAEVEANERSFYWSANVLYVHVRGTSKNPGSNGVSYEHLLLNSKGGIDTTSDKIRVDGIVIEGFCANKANGDPYPLHYRGDGTKTGVFTDCEMYWGPNHPAGHTNNSTPAGGNNANNGGSVWINCRWGWCVGDGSAEQFVAYSSGDGIECITIDCECIAGNAPFSGWGTGKHARPCFSHGGSPGLVMFIRTRVRPGPYQAVLPSKISPNTSSPFTDMSDARMFVIGEVLTISPLYTAPAILTDHCAIGADYNVLINCEYRMRMTDTTQGGNVTSLGQPGIRGVVLNTLVEMDFRDMQHTSARYACIGSFGDGDKANKAYSEFRFLTGNPNTRACLTYLGWAAPANANSPAVGTLHGCIISHEGPGTGRVGANNGSGYGAGGVYDASRQQGNTYIGLQQQTDVTGWSNDAAAVEAAHAVSQPTYSGSAIVRPVVLIQPRSPSAPYAAIGNAYRLEYDARGAVRGSVNTAHGRFEAGVLDITADNPSPPSQIGIGL